MCNIYLNPLVSYWFSVMCHLRLGIFNEFEIIFYVETKPDLERIIGRYVSTMLRTGKWMRLGQPNAHRSVLTARPGKTDPLFGGHYLFPCPGEVTASPTYSEVVYMWLTRILFSSVMSAYFTPNKSCPVRRSIEEHFGSKCHGFVECIQTDKCGFGPFRTIWIEVADVAFDRYIYI